jgi:hypothetical protein
MHRVHFVVPDKRLLVCVSSCDNVDLEIVCVVALSSGRIVFGRTVIMESKCPGALSITSIEFKVQLYTIANAVIVQSKVVLERTFTLSLQHNLMRLTTNTCCNHSLECFYTKSQYFSNQHRRYKNTY